MNWENQEFIACALKTLKTLKILKFVKKKP